MLSSERCCALLFTGLRLGEVLDRWRWEEMNLDEGAAGPDPGTISISCPRWGNPASAILEDQISPIF